MKSILFSSFDPMDKDNTEFTNDLQHLVNTNEEQWNIIMDYLPKLFISVPTSERKATKQELSKKSGLSLVEIQHDLSVISFFFNQFSDKSKGIFNDTPKSWADDLQSMGILKPDKVTFFISIMKQLKDKFKSTVSPILTEQQYQIGVIPTFSSIETTVEMRAMFENEYELETPVEDYIPKIIGVTPIISVVISASRGDSREFVFQASPSQIKTFIESLRSTLKESDQLTRAFKPVKN